MIRRKFTVTGSGIGWSGGRYTIKTRATPIEAAHKAARRIWREAKRKKIEKPYINFIVREIGTQRTWSYRAYRQKLATPRTYIRGAKTVVSNYEYSAKPCGASEFTAPVSGGGDDAYAEFFRMAGGGEEEGDKEGEEEEDDGYDDEEEEEGEEEEEEEEEV